MNRLRHMWPRFVGRSNQQHPLSPHLLRYSLVYTFHTGNDKEVFRDIPHVLNDSFLVFFYCFTLRLPLILFSFYGH